MSNQSVETPTIESLADGFFVRQAIDNMAWVDMGEYALVVDALEQPSLREEVFSALRDTLGDLPVRYVLNTHTHHDHTALNDAFVREYDAEIINAETATIPHDGKVIQGDARQAVMLAMPGAHTSSDCVIFFPTDNVLCTGDLFGWGLAPPNGPLQSGQIETILDYYEKMTSLQPEHVVPGHGPLCTNQELRRWMDYFRSLIRSVTDCLENGMADEEIRNSLTPPNDMKDWWRFTDWKHEDTLGKVINAAHAGRFSENPASDSSEIR
jgi:cyclase